MVKEIKTKKYFIERNLMDGEFTCNQLRDKYIEMDYSFNYLTIKRILEMLVEEGVLESRKKDTEKYFGNPHTLYKVKEK